MRLSSAETRCWTGVNVETRPVVQKTILDTPVPRKSHDRSFSIPSDFFTHHPYHSTRYSPDTDSVMKQTISEGTQRNVLQCHFMHRRLYLILRGEKPEQCRDLVVYMFKNNTFIRHTLLIKSLQSSLWLLISKTLKVLCLKNWFMMMTVALMTTMTVVVQTFFLSCVLKLETVDTERPVPRLQKDCCAALGALQLLQPI